MRKKTIFVGHVDYEPNWWISMIQTAKYLLEIDSEGLNFILLEDTTNI